MSNFLILLARIDQAKAELDAMRPLDRELENRILQKFRLWWTYHSNAIEGNKLTQGETEMFLMEGLTAKGKPLKDHLDLRGHSNAVNYLLAFIRGNEKPLTEAEIRKLHEVLLVEAYLVPVITPDGLPAEKTIAPGQYKTQPNHVRTLQVKLITTPALRILRSGCKSWSIGSGPSLEIKKCIPSRLPHGFTTNLPRFIPSTMETGAWRDCL